MSAQQQPGGSALTRETILRALGLLSEELGKPVATGEFGSDMQVALVNDGPVTLLFDTKARE